MRFASNIIFCCLFCWGCYGSKNISSTQETPRKLFAVWENLNRQEYLQNYQAIPSIVDTVLQLSASLPRFARQWYHGTSYLCRARAQARLNNTLEARRDILLALDSGCRNDAAIESDSILMFSVGKHWFDSIVNQWMWIQYERKKRWGIQQPIVLASDKSIDGKRPMIIALHGGNGSHEEFASHFWELPKKQVGVIAFPPGPIKFSRASHSWPSDSRQSDSLLFTVIDSLKKQEGVDTTAVFLIGYSQGAATAAGFALRHPEVVKGVLMLSGFINEPLAESVFAKAAKSGLSFYAISGSTDLTFLPSIHNLLVRCRKDGIAFHYEERQGMLHSVPLTVEDEVVAAMHWFRNPQLGAK